MAGCGFRLPLAVVVALALTTSSVWTTRAAAQPEAPAENEDEPPRAGADGADASEQPHAQEVADLLGTLTSGDMDERAQAADDLAALGASVATLEDALRRERDADEQARRRVLAEIDAAVPDSEGRFRGQGRRSQDELREDDAFDWLEHLYELDEMPGIGSVIADVAAVRALAATEKPDAARAILDFAFSEDGLVIRDECGRRLRAMAPYSVPALVRAAGDRDEPTRKRGYSRYQLERIDREAPSKALAAAPDEALKIEILRAYADTEWREAVFAVLERIDHDSPPVRAQARETWLAYVTGPPPPPAPRRRLQITTGQYTQRAQPLYLNSRDLADYALRNRYSQIFGEAPDRDASLEELSREIFSHHDENRQRQLVDSFEAAKTLAEAGESAAAVAEFDRILVQDPDFPRRSEMVDAYLSHGEELAEAGTWRDAASAYAKAHMLDPNGPRADEAERAQLAARAEALGEDELGGVKAGAPPDTREAGERPWLLFGGIGVGLAAVLLGALGLAVRRRRVRES